MSVSLKIAAEAGDFVLSTIVGDYQMEVPVRLPPSHASLIFMIAAIQSLGPNVNVVIDASIDSPGMPDYVNARSFVEGAHEVARSTIGGVLSGVA